MEFLIAIAVIVGIVILIKSGGSKPDVDRLTANQMNRHTKSLQNRLEQLRKIPDRTEAIKAEIGKVDAQLDHALSVWRRKNDEASGLSMNMVTQEVFDAAEAGEKLADYVIGMSYYNGTAGLPHDYQKAFFHLKRAATNGHADSTVLLVAMYLGGIGVERDLVKAMHAAKYLRQGKHPEGENLVATVRALQKMENESVLITDQMLEAANNGDITACKIVGEAYLRGNKGLVRNDQKGAELFKVAADAEDPFAIFVMFELAKQGRGVPVFTDIETSTKTMIDKVLAMSPRPDQDMSTDVKDLMASLPDL